MQAFFIPGACRRDGSSDGDGLSDWNKTPPQLRVYARADSWCAGEAAGARASTVWVEDPAVLLGPPLRPQFYIDY